MANNEKMNISYTIKAIDRFTKTHKKLERQLNSIKQKVNGVAGNYKIDIDASTRTANDKIEDTQDKVDRLTGNKFINFIVKGWKDTRSTMDRMATTLRTIEELNQGTVRGGLFALIPAIGPAAATAAGGLGAMASALIPAVGGLGAFAAVATPVISDLFVMDQSIGRNSEAWKKLTQTERDALDALDGFQFKLREVKNAFKKPILEIFTQNLKSAEKLLELFYPTLESTVTAIKNLSKAFDKALGSDDVKAFFKWMGETAGPNLEKLTKSIGNFFVGFMNMMVAFDPLAQDFLTWFLDLSKRFREWSATLEQNKAFQNFIKYVRENGPLMLDVIKNLTKFLVNLGIALAPLGEKILQLVNWLLKSGAAFFKNHEVMTRILGILALVTSAFGLISVPVILLITIFKNLWPIISKVFQWFGKLKGVFLRVIPVGSRIVQMLLGFTNPIGLVISAVILLATIIFSNWDSIKKWTLDMVTKLVAWFIEFKTKATAKINELVAKAVAKIIEMKNDFDRFVARIVANVIEKFLEMKQGIEKWMDNAWETITDIWNNIENFFSDIDLWSIGADIIQGLVDGISSVDVMGVVSNIGSSIKSGFTNFFNINSPSKLMNRDVGRWITLGVLDGMVRMKSKAEREAERVAEAIKRPFDNMSRDYTFTASAATSRGQYESVRYGGARTKTNDKPTEVGGDTYYVTIDAKNVQEFTDVVNMVKGARQSGRKGG